FGFLKNGPWNCRNLACFLKEGQTIHSKTLKHWDEKTCGSFSGLSCSAANDRVASKCQSDFNNNGLQLHICKQKDASIPTYPNKLTVWVTKMGKAHCMSNNANNFWMDKDHNGVPKRRAICCTKIQPILPWLPLQIYNLPC
uniref:Uncharacterized protein n=1 Tax=Clytia hemisphaerica TaxID=252671 RepID=A0A7M5VAD0_9CNID